MEGKILRFRREDTRLIKIAERKANDGDCVGALGFLFSAVKENPSYENYAKVAELYSDMGLLDISNDWWFKYLSVAPKDKLSRAYQEIAINFFYLDNVWMSGYYFQLKVSVDGFINKDDLDDDIVDYINETTDRRTYYRIAYPPERVDYTRKIKTAKSALSTGNTAVASDMFAEIPYFALDEETCGDAATSFFLDEKDDKAIDVCKYSLDKFGENVTAYCNLSSVYHIKKDKEKSEYYYKRAISSRKGEPEEYYRLATCAIEQNDHKRVLECIEFILSERPFDIGLMIFYGIALLNVGEYEKAEENFALLRRIVPSDFVAEYYLNLSVKLKRGGNSSEQTFKYEKDIPSKVRTSYKRTVKEVCENPVSIKSFMRRRENRNILRYGLACSDRELVRKCIYILAFSDSPKATEILLESLMCGGYSMEVKENAIRALIISDKVSEFGVVCAFMYSRVKVGKLIFREAEDSAEFLAAYAKAFANIVVADGKKEKLAFTINKMYKKMHALPEISDYDSDELAALALCVTDFGLFSNESVVIHTFGVKKERLAALKKLYNQGEEKEKKND